MLNTYQLDLALAVNILKTNNIVAFQRNEGIYLLLKRQEQEAQRLLDKQYYAVSDLLPVQFHFMLAKSGLDGAIRTVLDALKSEDINKYALYMGYLNGARFYEFSKTYAMYQEVKEKLIEVNSALDFNLEQLKDMWREASQI